MTDNRSRILGGLQSTVLMLSAATCVYAQEAEDTALSVEVFQLRPDDVTAMIASSGSLSRWRSARP